MAIDRRTFSAALVAGAAASLTSFRGMAATATPTKARNVVFVHGLFADGSSWSEVIARLQVAGLNTTSVQNPLTSLDDAVTETRRVLAEQDGPTVLVGHSFSGVLVSEVGLDPKVKSLVYVAARAPDAGEDFAALAKQYPTPPATAGIVYVVIRQPQADPNTGKEIYIAGRSKSGSCYYVHHDSGNGRAVEYASDSGCGASDIQTYNTKGW